MGGENQPPRIVFDARWRIDGKLGAGGMGSVLRATDLQSGEVVALKTLGLQHADNPEFVKRFEREAQLLSRLDHPALPRFIGLFRHKGVPFFVMRLVEGRQLSSLIDDGIPLEPGMAGALLRQLGEVLTHLHARGVVHRDLKPENLLVDDAGRLSLVDFGISAETNVTRLTLPGLAIGTPLYMAPEQIKEGLATPASDVYAMGLLAFTLLVGEHPFAKGSPAGIMARQLHEAPALASVANPALPRPVAEVLQRALEKAPAARFDSAMAFVDALELALRNERGSGSFEVPTDKSAWVPRPTEPMGAPVQPLPTQSPAPAAASASAVDDDEDDDATEAVPFPVFARPVQPATAGPVIDEPFTDAPTERRNRPEAVAAASAFPEEQTERQAKFHGPRVPFPSATELDVASAAPPSEVSLPPQGQPARTEWFKEPAFLVAAGVFVVLLVLLVVIILV